MLDPNDGMSCLTPMFSYVIAPVADLREHPVCDSEVVSQVYFSESVRVLEEQGNWMKIKNNVDEYEGWIRKEALCFRENAFLPASIKTIAKVNRLCVHLYDREETNCGAILSLPFDSQLEVLSPLDLASTSRWIKVSLPNGQEAYIQRGDVLLNPTLSSLQEMCQLARNFLGLPYIWGGRSSFGYDCSGFIQMLYRQIKVFLPRDAKDQINSPLFCKTSLEKLKPGDLVFFGSEYNKITHVGMYLENDCFIHSTVAENAPYLQMTRLSSPYWNGSGLPLSYIAFRTMKLDENKK